jgi:hypothetical protein
VHLHNVFDKLAIHNRTMLALLALRGGGGVTTPEPGAFREHAFEGQRQAVSLMCTCDVCERPGAAGC